jgi:hypothetical protein
MGGYVSSVAQKWGRGDTKRGEAAIEQDNFTKFKGSSLFHVFHSV